VVVTECKDSICRVAFRYPRARCSPHLPQLRTAEHSKEGFTDALFIVSPGGKTVNSIVDQFHARGNGALAGPRAATAGDQAMPKAQNNRLRRRSGPLPLYGQRCALQMLYFAIYLMTTASNVSVLCRLLLPWSRCKREV
jgi:hypothetical protein